MMKNWVQIIHLIVTGWAPLQVRETNIMLYMNATLYG